jgi:tetratricopeptide (TPR) repeat protein
MTARVGANPRDFEAFNQRGNFYLRTGNPERAIADYDKAIAVNPRAAVSYTNRGEAYRLQGQLDRSLADLDKAIAINAKFMAALSLSRARSHEQRRLRTRDSRL